MRKGKFETRTQESYTPLNSKDVIVLYLLVAKKAWKREGLKLESIEAR